MKHYIHVNQHNIRHNIKSPDNPKPVITCKNYKTNKYTNNLTLKDKDGNEILKVLYSPDKPLSCGAKVYIEVDDKNVEIEYE